MRLTTKTLPLALCFALTLATSFSTLLAQTDDQKSTDNQKTAQTETDQPESATKPSKPIQDDSKSADSSSDSDSATSDEARKKNFELTFDDLKFEMEKGSKFDRSLLTDKINSYNNNTISVRGYIRPSFSQSGLTKFIFVRDNKECCFGPGAALYDCILVRLTKGSTTDFTVRPVTIEGTFSLKEYNGPDGKVWSIYRMNDTEVK